MLNLDGKDPYQMQMQKLVDAAMEKHEAANAADAETVAGVEEQDVPLDLLKQIRASEKAIEAAEEKDGANKALIGVIAVAAAIVAVAIGFAWNAANAEPTIDDFEKWVIAQEEAGRQAPAEYADPIYEEAA